MASSEFLRRTGHKLRIFGDALIDHTPGVTVPIQHNDNISIGNLSIRAIHTPCHTRGSLCYYVTSQDDSTSPGILFTGDTLFVGGVGAFFEGTSEDMVNSFAKLLELPRETIIYCGHDYAMNFFPNAIARDPENKALANRLEWALAAKQQGVPAMPTSLEDECNTNLFLRVLSNTSEMASLYPAYDPKSSDLASLMSMVYDTV
jgi:hydroxyacylglutathione hydrolase